MTFWETEEWFAYERAYGDAPGTRAALLRAAAWNTRLIDLRTSQDGLWLGIAKTMRQTITKGRRLLDSLLTEPPESAFSAYEALHRSLANRPSQTYNCQRSWLASNLAFVIAGFGKEGAALGACYVVHSESYSYYFSGPSVARDVLPALLWESIVEAKRRGSDVFDIGWQGEATTEKGRQIEWFKSRWGGVDVPARKILHALPAD